MNEREIRAIVAAEVTKHRPTTQYECCLIGARCVIAACGVPPSDLSFIDTGKSLAVGLFGPAFTAADYGQKSLWVDMCERALREVAGGEDSK